MASPAQAQLEIINDSDRAGVVLHPIRKRILCELQSPDSATGLAKKLNLPRQKVNYHLRELEREGFVNLVEQRNRRNCIERIVQATATSYIINPQVLGELGDTPEAIRDRFSSAYLVAAATQMVRDVATLRQRASDVEQSLATLTLQVDVRFANAKDRHGFAEELSNEIARLTEKYHNESAPDGREYRFLLGSHPVITKSEVQAQAEKARHQDGEGAPS